MKLSKIALTSMEHLQEAKNAAQQRDRRYADMVADLRNRMPSLYKLFNSTPPVDLAMQQTMQMECVTTDPIPVTAPKERHTDSFDLRELSLVPTLNSLLRDGVACGKGIPISIQIPPASINLLAQANFVHNNDYVWCGTVRIPLEAIPCFHSDAILLIY